MEIVFVESIKSTQLALIEGIREGKIKAPFAILAQFQSAGVGSRDNAWQGQKDNFYLSFALNANELASDLPISSASIYFAYLMCEHLNSLGSKAWLKWPNDLYLGQEKLGGIITTKLKGTFVCGIGINLINAPQNCAVLDIQISAKTLAQGFLKSLENLRSWKEILSKYSLQFSLCKNFSVHIDGKELSMACAELQNDGSIIIDNKKVFSAR